MSSRPLQLPQTALPLSARELGVIVLAGGRGRRLGETDKARLTVGGRRFIDVLLAGIPYGAQVAVVSPHWLGMPTTSESPLYGGPLAGIGAGTRALGARRRHARPYTAILSVDAPLSPACLPGLATALLARPDAESALIRADDGRLQPLCALWRTEALHARLADADQRGEGLSEGLHGGRAMAIYRRATTVTCPGGGFDRDVDTPADLERLRRCVAAATW